MFIHAQVYSNAGASSARRFLIELIGKAPCTITSVQLHGGSGFMAEFETACRELNMDLIVLPPGKLTYNGGVERGNRSFREELYYRRDLLADSIGAIRYEIKQAVLKYNTCRPHKNLTGQTPVAYVQNTIVELNDESRIT